MPEGEQPDIGGDGGHPRVGVLLGERHRLGRLRGQPGVQGAESARPPGVMRPTPPSAGVT
jgi:hypothetical protein